MSEGNFWGELIRSLREEKGISQRVLAERARVNRSTLRRIEAGKTSGDIATMERVLDFLGYELEALDKEGQRISLEELQERQKLRDEPSVNRLLSLRLA
jgi:Predicted transcriptional regulator with C-terminal CBS domains